MKGLISPQSCRGQGYEVSFIALTRANLISFVQLNDKWDEKIFQKQKINDLNSSQSYRKQGFGMSFIAAT